MLSRRLIQKLEALNAEDRMYFEGQIDLVLAMRAGRCHLVPAVGASPADPAWLASCAAVKGGGRFPAIAVLKHRQAKIFELIPPRPMPRARHR